MNVIRIRKLKALLFKETRIEAGLSQDQLALMTGLHQATISRMESGEFEWRCDSEYLFFEAIRFYKESNQLINQ